jgi:hypothetical protein
MKNDSYLIISDVHLPYHNSQALRFCKQVKKDFDIPDSNIYCVGDLEDQYGFTHWPKTPEAKHTVEQELEAVRVEIRKWELAFPEMKICTSNHGSRIVKKAIAAELPSQIIKSVQEIFQYPKNWQIEEQYIVCATKKEFAVEHGEGFSGRNGHIEAALLNGISTAIGHLHSHAGVNHIKTRHQELWALNVGCLIDPVSFAFAYGKNSKFKPCIGTGVVLDGGRNPIWLPM